MSVCLLILSLTGIRFLIALFNYLFRPRFPNKCTQEEPLISVLIPARNEEARIGHLLEDLRRQDYSNLEILVLDDQSTDQTAHSVQARQSADSRICYLYSNTLPEGWLGKNHACHRLAERAKGEYFLFLDADVRVGNRIIRQSLTVMRQYSLGLLSIFPKQEMLTLGERLTVPLMHSILLSLLPLWLVRRSGYVSLAAANGQCMLFHAATYRQHQPHERWKSSPVEDIMIARDFKKKKIRIACMTGNTAITCRMYEGFGEAVQGFAKNVKYFFGNSYILATLYWMITTLGWIPILIFCAPVYLIAYLLVMFTTEGLIAFTANSRVFHNLLLLIPRQWVLGWIICQGWVYQKRKNYRWKDRVIY